MRNRRLTLTLAALGAVFFAYARDPVPVGDRLQVLCDATTVDAAATTAERRQHRPEFAGTVLVHDRPWEGDMCGYYNILRDEDEKGVLYRMYYQGAAWGVKGSRFGWTGLKICYAESRDGLAWTRPDLGIWTFNGSKKNNIILDRSQNYWDNFMVMKDPNPDCPAAERYKGIALYLTPTPGDPKRESERGLIYLSSPDGIHFKRERMMMRRWQPPHNLSFDSLNVVFWDSVRKEYRMYLRGQVNLPDRPRYCHFETKPGAPEWVRSVKVITSRDFKTWTEPVEIGVDCKGGRFDMYTNNIEPYFRNPRLYLGFPTRYSERMVWTDTYDRLCSAQRRSERSFRKPACGERMREGLAMTDAVVMWSADGQNFTVGEEAFLTPGPEHDGNWVYGSCYLARGMVETPGRRGDANELSFYPYVGRFSGNATELDRYVLRMDGFVSYHAAVEPRKLVTRPIVFEGDELLVNFATSVYGYLRITVRGEDGQTAVSHELFGDAVDRLVGFEKGDLAKFSGKPVTLTFEISDGDVYAYRFRRIPPANIAVGGKAGFRIAVDPDASALDLEAAEDLRTHLREATGADFVLVTNDFRHALSRTIEVGTRRAKDLVGRLRLENFTDGECAAVYRDGSVAIAGAGEMGTSYGVSLFLEKVLGCRWLGPAGEKVVPKQDTVTFGSLDLHEKPAYPYRWILDLDNQVRFHPEGRRFLKRNRLNVAEGNFPGTALKVTVPNCHSLFSYLPPHGGAENFRNHPEWYTLNKDGKRVDDKQLCFTNPELRQELTKKVLEKIAAHGGAGFFDISARDVPGSFCHCPTCKAAEKKYDSFGGPFFDYLLEVGPQVKAKHPKAKLHFLVYRKEQTQHPPKGIGKFPDNMCAVFAPIDDDFSKNYLHPHNRGTYEDLKRWCELVEVWAWYYPIPYSGFPPYVALQRIGDDTRLAFEAGQKGCCYEHDHGVAQGVNFSDLITWVTTRLYREPTLDPMALAEEFCSGYYGAAAKDMMTFVRALEQISSKTDDFLTWDGTVSGAFPVGRLLTFNRLFDRMERLVKDDPQALQRVREARIGLDIETLGKFRDLRTADTAFKVPADAIRDRALAALKASVARRFPLADEKKRTDVRQRIETVIADAHMRATHAFKPLPPEFADVAPDRILQFYPDGSYHGLETKAMVDAAAGFAIREPRTEENQRKYPFNFGVFDYANGKPLVRRALPYGEIVPDVFKLYRVGRTRITSPKCAYWNTYSWGMGAKLEAAWKPGVETEWDVWASLKFEGPVYSTKSVCKESNVWLDRVVLIRCETEKGK